MFSHCIGSHITPAEKRQFLMVASIPLKAFNTHGMRGPDDDWESLGARKAKRARMSAEFTRDYFTASPRKTVDSPRKATAEKFTGIVYVGDRHFFNSIKVFNIKA
jgi:hypothetical protein